MGVASHVGTPYGDGSVGFVRGDVAAFPSVQTFAPALAIAMVPLLLPIRVLLWFPLLAAVGAAYFILVGKYLSTR
jgi:hypothetical protein